MIALWLSVALAANHATLSAPPLAGEALDIVITGDDEHPVAGQTLRVNVHPGSPGGREVGIGITDSLGRVRWTPDAPGVTELIVGDEPLLRFSVASRYPPPSVVVPLILVALGALGALIYGWRR